MGSAWLGWCRLGSTLPSRAGPRHAKASRTFVHPVSRNLFIVSLAIFSPSLRATFSPSLRASNTSILDGRCCKKRAGVEVQSISTQRSTNVSARLGQSSFWARLRLAWVWLGSAWLGWLSPQLGSAQPGLTRLGSPWSLELISCRLSSVLCFLRHILFLTD